MDEYTGQDVQPRYLLEDGTPLPTCRISPRNEEKAENCREMSERFIEASILWAKDSGINGYAEKHTSLMKNAEAASKFIDAVPQNPVLHLGLDFENKARLVTKYQYRPLVKDTEIRLLRLTGMVAIDRCNYLTCEIVHADLDSAPTYQAVSYAWGALDVNYPIIINDTECLLITRSLQDFLEQAFSFSENIKTERSRQVLLMRRIFQESFWTHLWLGKEDESTHWLESLLASIEENSPKYETAIASANQPVVKEAISILESDPAIARIPPGSYPGWKAAAQITYRPWFSRLWVFQEAIAAPKARLVCGKYVLSLHTLELALILLPTIWSKISIHDLDHFDRISSMRINHDIFHGPKEIYGDFRQDLLQLMQATRRYQCSDTRDRVFAALSLQSEEDRISIPIDYNQTVNAVYIDTAKRIVLGQQNLRTLEYITEERDLESLALPSWTPNWIDQNLNGRDPFEGNLAKKLKFNASGCPFFRPEFTGCGKILLARGKIIDTVETLASDMLRTYGQHGPTSENLSQELLFHSLLKLVENRLFNEAVGSQRPDQAQLIVVRTLTADGTRIRRTPKISQFDDRHALALADMLQYSKPPSELAVDASRNLSPLLYICSGRVIATLRNRYICLAPMITQEDDVIGLLQGSSLPWVLRPQIKSGQYKVVGACYVDGVMYNEEDNTADTLSDTIELV
ncbi:hypothetical protein MMC11_000871 [Xylographa trunciseda]|nr:hypothetical protein [Xylographa trunciseda]